MASYNHEVDEEQAELGVDFHLWELKDRVEPWLFAMVTFIIVGLARMMHENVYILCLGKQELGISLLHAFKVSELLGAMMAGLVLTFFRATISPGKMIIIAAFIQVVAQANMLNPDREDLKTETLLKITTSLAAISEGSYLVSFASYVHEEYGQKQWGVIFGYILTAGAMGYLAIDEGVLIVTL